MITVTINDMEVRRVFIDGRSSADIMFSSTFEEMGIPSSFVEAPGIDLLGFRGELITPISRVELSVTFGAVGCSRTESIMFGIIDLPYQYNIIFGSVSLNKFGAIPHHAYLCMKIPKRNGIITIHGDQHLS